MTASSPIYPVQSAEAGQWLITALEKPWGRSPEANYVAAVIPRGFAAYARLFHPAYLGSPAKAISWADVARYSGKMPHAEMQWQAIVNDKARSRSA